MQKYYRLDWTTNEKKNIFLEDFKASEKIDEKGDEGITLANEEFPSVKFKNKKGVKADILVGASTFPVVSEKFKDVMADFANDLVFLEFIPIRFTNLTGKDKLPNYYFLNILENIPCFDWDKSIYTRYPKDIFPEHQHLVRKIEKLVINRKRIEERNIFRMKEKRIPVYISQYLKEVIEQRNLIGMVFTEIDIS